MFVGMLQNYLSFFAADRYFMSIQKRFGLSYFARALLFPLKGALNIGLGIQSTVIPHIVSTL